MSRASLALSILLCVSAGPLPAQDDIRFKSGNIQVRHATRVVDDDGQQIQVSDHGIMRDQIDFGRCFEDVKYRRVPITYYHPQGPLGLALGRFNWFGGGVNTYPADARLPASLTGLSCPSAAMN